MKLTIDFETRSEADLKKVGAYAYSMHESTSVLCVGWDHGQWRRGQPYPTDLFADIEIADEVEAHSAFFEMCIWQNVCQPRYDWPAIPFHKWRCSAAKAAAVSIPRSLAGAGSVMGAKIVKDEMYGKSAMMKLSRPRKPTKNDPSIWNEDPEVWKLMLEYNVTDVKSEIALSAMLPNLQPTELELWRLTELMNLRGFAVDVDGIKRAIKICEEYAEFLTAEFHKITGVSSPTQRAKFLVWLNKRGVLVGTTEAAALDSIIDMTADATVRRASQIVRELGRSSVKKYEAMLNMAVGGRVRGCFLYCGAQATGRWSGRNVQPQNFPRASIIKDQDKAWEVISTDLETVNMIDDPMKVMSGALRGAIWAPAGRDLLCGDYAQIEARGTCWLAGEKKTLEVFARGEDVYLRTASTIFGRQIKKEETDKRFLGKQAELALGFGAGFVKFLIHCRNLGAPPFTDEQIRELVPQHEIRQIRSWIESDGWDMVKRLMPSPTREDIRELVLAKYIVDRYRADRRNTVVKLWRDLETAAKNAVANPGKAYKANDKVAYALQGRFLKCRLPSGRIIYYPFPRLNERGELTYMREANGKWVRDKTYGGKLTENCVQGLARDIAAEGMLRLHNTPPYHEIVLTSHDEIVSEIDEGVGDLDKFLALMEKRPAWAKDLPIKAEGWRGKRYRK